MVTRERAADRRYGLGKSLMPVVEALRDLGHEVRYLCQDDLSVLEQKKRDRWLDKINHFPGIHGRLSRQIIAGSLFERVHMGYVAAHVAHQEHFDVVHFHDPWISLGWRAFRMRYGLRKKTSSIWGISQHGFGSYSFAVWEDGLKDSTVKEYRTLLALERWQLAASDFVIAPAKLALSQLQRDCALPVRPGHWHVVPHARPDFVLPERAVARAQLAWQDEGFYILAVGRLVPLKQFSRLIDAFSAIFHEFPRAYLVILGHGEEVDALKHQAAALGVSSRVQMSVVDDVRPFLSAADLYVSVSSSESFGLANFEALAAGLPCICTAVGAVPEVLGAGAFYLDPCALNLSEVLRRFMTQPDLCAHYRALAQVRMSQTLGAFDVAKKLLDIYQTSA